MKPPAGTAKGWLRGWLLTGVVNGLGKKHASSGQDEENVAAGEVSSGPILFLGLTGADCHCVLQVPMSPKRTSAVVSAAASSQTALRWGKMRQMAAGIALQVRVESVARLLVPGASWHAPPLWIP